MFEVQLRYFQYILSVSIVVGLVIQSSPLLVASFVGIILTWLSEMLSAQLNIYSIKYFVVLNVLLLGFSSFIFSNFFEQYRLNIFLLLLIFVSLTYFLFQKEVNIFQIGNLLFLLFIGSISIGYISGTEFITNKNFVSYIFLILLLLKSASVFFNLQFTNFQYFFDFFLVALTTFGVSFFSDYQIINTFIAIIPFGLMTTFLNFLFVKLRYEYKYTKKITKQIYIFDYLVAMIASLYLIKLFNLINGLF